MTLNLRMESLENIRDRIAAKFPGAAVQLIPNPGPSGQSSLGLDAGHAVEIARFLKDEPDLRFDYLSNVTGVDWLDRTMKEKVKVSKEVEGETKEVIETQERVEPGYLEAVYHLYSMELKHGPLVLRLRSENRQDPVHLPSLTPVWRSAEFQEREVYDLYGIHFDGHPDLRRILMWEEFEDYPMRKDYVEPDDYEYEPTPHAEVLDKARRHYPQTEEESA